jgi:uncharacterized glyoxalase superfamily protein PhnB
MPYLIVNGAEDFMDFTETIFGAVEKMKMMRDEQKVMHAEIVIGESVIMLADATEQYAARTSGLYVCVANCDDTYNKAMSLGAKSIIAPGDQEYGRSAGFEDMWGNTWWVTS